MVDIVERLRETAAEFESIGHDAEELHEASDEIELLRGLLREVRGRVPIYAPHWDLRDRIDAALRGEGE